MPDPHVAFFALQTTSNANGGLESLTQIIRRLDGRRAVVTNYDGRFTALWRGLPGVEVHVFDLPEIRALSGAALARYQLARAPALAAANARFGAIVRRIGARVAHFNDIGAFFFGAAGARAAGARTLLNVRDTRPPGAAYGLKWRLAYHLADELVGLSREMKDELERRLRPLAPRAPHARVGYVYSAIDLERMRPAMDRAAVRAELGIAPGELAIVYVGTFNEKKAQLALIENALAPLLARLPHARVHFVGDFEPAREPYARACEVAARALADSDRVVFHGFFERPELFYQAADVVLLASQNEGLARAMIESLACGTPVVSFDVSSAREILEAHGTGRVVRRGDYGGLVGALTDLATEGAYKNVRERCTELARDLFDPRRSVEKYVEIYARLAGRGA
ncbi:MAG: glycosyltransferase family 4 protein [Polyangiaceae bacterium]